MMQINQNWKKKFLILGSLFRKPIAIIQFQKAKCNNKISETENKIPSIMKCFINCS